MIEVFKKSWALFLGIGLLMVGNGMQSTLLGVRGALEGFDTATMSYVMSGYYLGFLGGSRMAPEMIKRVGHIRVFAALASFISAVYIIYAVAVNPYMWMFLRVIVGFCMSGVYVVAESWLNDSATNENRGQTLSLYLIVQMLGLVIAQALLNTADVGGFQLFILISVLVSLSFGPILLSVSPAPIYGTTKPMSLKQLFETSPLGCVGVFLVGGMFSVQFGMASIYGIEKGMSVADISIFIAAICFGGLFFQYPIGWLSDRLDRRWLIVIIAIMGMTASVLCMVFNNNVIEISIGMFIIGGTSSPLYSLFIAYTNDYLEHDDMAAASGGLIFINGIGAVLGPVIVGLLMANYGPDSFFAFIFVMFMAVVGYALYRMTKRAATTIEESSTYQPVLSTASPIAIDMAFESEPEDELTH